MNVGGIRCGYISIINNTRVWSSLKPSAIKRKAANQTAPPSPSALIGSSQPLCSVDSVSSASKTDNVLLLQAGETQQIHRNKEHIAA